MGKTSRQKGKTGERAVVALAKSYGLSAQRTWDTAQSTDPATRACDVLIGDIKVQVKWLESLPKPFYECLENVDVAFVRENGGEWLVVERATNWLLDRAKCPVCEHSWLEHDRMMGCRREKCGCDRRGVLDR